jgi:hypothetical protein
VTGWEPPRCRHGSILLGCPHGNCQEQNDYLAKQKAAIDAYWARVEADTRAFVRRLLGLPVDNATGAGEE